MYIGVRATGFARTAPRERSLPDDGKEEDPDNR
jgi:hypothetical protein